MIRSPLFQLFLFGTCFKSDFGSNSSSFWVMDYLPNHCFSTLSLPSSRRDLCRLRNCLPSSSSRRQPVSPTAPSPPVPQQS
ncbi:hypothetical protein L1987_12876 [Smallanthus sonchifolius]|uniref:Uncharacterized protein n=1 Tax=Smallanthus sonchifolius TaxID=185202 RepID=A0ACB9JF09_9ASTR|nr:hypothetical protein L1987_12876 [Smallanthus sonchifolius]